MQSNWVTSTLKRVTQLLTPNMSEALPIIALRIYCARRTAVSNPSKSLRRVHPVLNSFFVETRRLYFYWNSITTGNVKPHKCFAHILNNEDDASDQFNIANIPEL